MLAMLMAVVSAFMATALPSKMQQSNGHLGVRGVCMSMGMGGKGFGGGEATRDPAPSAVRFSASRRRRCWCCHLLLAIWCVVRRERELQCLRRIIRGQGHRAAFPTRYLTSGSQHAFVGIENNGTTRTPCSTPRGIRRLVERSPMVGYPPGGAPRAQRGCTSHVASSWVYTHCACSPSCWQPAKRVTTGKASDARYAAAGYAADGYPRQPAAAVEEAASRCEESRGKRGSSSITFHGSMEAAYPAPSVACSQDSSRQHVHGLAAPQRSRAQTALAPLARMDPPAHRTAHPHRTAWQSSSGEDPRASGAWAAVMSGRIDSWARKSIRQAKPPSPVGSANDVTVTSPDVTRCHGMSQGDRERSR